MNEDFEEFKKNISWFISQSDKIDFLNTETEIELTEKFCNTFPILSNLISKARILTLKINNQLYKLFSWTNKNGLSCGWLNKIEQNTSSQLPIIEEHKLLLNEIGGIQESYNQPEPSLSNNQNFMFIESECSLGINDWDDYYKELCEEENVEPINYKNLVCFVVEANGDANTYDPKTKEILLFSHDHCFDNVEVLENQPEYTFHTINGVVNFVDYVETLAAEWKNEIKKHG
ncbi:hypothetical protein OMO38_15975 [Chryseobacterium sp. 09-1422]|uniref:SMI1/KNR4 family protein n=1 Tax=Chryseobacterium kimseyorum TaxID=2984028 RepID=A0ABT3I1W6_9FLAO|nr:hypothetical protein [Chryseobacterium kimseyorum]MCW3170023.1 hypothetical protein [Chryseobacterium kimseyorum]